jgi:hypothetical protein
MEMTDTRIVKSILAVGVLNVLASGGSASLGETVGQNPDVTLRQAVKISDRLFAILFPAADEAG